MVESHLIIGESMKTADSRFLGKRVKSLVCIGMIGLGLVAVLAGQNKIERDYVIRLGVEEVRLDAVVLDRKGRQITDLTLNDFEIRQGLANQKLTSAIYINEYPPRPQTQPKQTEQSPSAPVSMLKQGEVHRTFVFVVDNIALDFLQFCDARTVLKKFIHEQMQSGDLVAIVPTAGGATEFQTFTSDKQHLNSIINNLPWLSILNQWNTKDLNKDLDDQDRIKSDEELNDFHMATKYCIKALGKMPGRKSLFLLSTRVWLKGSMADFVRIQRIYNELADDALRAGVVIHTLDMEQLTGPEQIYPDFRADKGLQNIPPFDPTRDIPAADPVAVSQGRNSLASTLLWALNQRRQIPLSEKTGGLFVTDSNFSSSPSGIGRASEMIKGYYLLTYIPPADTFSKNSKKEYMHIRVKVKRSGGEVHARTGFFRTPESLSNSYENVSTLQEAINSPFRYNDLNVSLTSGFIDDPHKGYLLQSWLHVNGKDISIGGAKGGMHSVSIEGVCITSNIDNVIQDSNARRYEYSVKSEDIPWIKEHGLRFSISLPIKKPGAYYVRAAMKDQGSGKIGSAYQYINIPDLKNGRLAFSDIFIVDRDEDLPWARSESSELSPNLRRDSGKSAAIRNYAPGETIEYAAIIYNAKSDTEQKPDLESQLTLFGNGKELVKGNIVVLDISGVNDLKRIPIRKKLMLEKSLLPGDYILLLQVTDKQASKNKNIASQSLSFKVLAN
jgi:VWFA-related protein